MGIESLVSKSKKYLNWNNGAYFSSDALGTASGYGVLMAFTYLTRDSDMASSTVSLLSVGLKSAVSMGVTIGSYHLLNKKHAEKNDTWKLIGAGIPGMVVSDSLKVGIHYTLLEKGMAQSIGPELTVLVSYIFPGVVGRGLRYGLNASSLMQVIRPNKE